MEPLIYSLVVLGFAIFGFRLDRLSRRVAVLEKSIAAAGAKAPPHA